MITLTPISPVGAMAYAYRINGKNCSFMDGEFSFVTSGEDVVNILGPITTYVMISPFKEDENTNYQHTIMATIDDSESPSIIFDGTKGRSYVEFAMETKCEIVFKVDESAEKDNNDMKHEYAADMPKIKNMASSIKPDVRPDCGDSVGDIDGDSDKITITETESEKPEKCEKPEKKPANIAEITSYDRVMNAIYDIFSENSVIEIDRDLFNDICTDGISIEARNWKVSMHPYIVAFWKELCPYTRVLHLSIEKTRKHHNGIYCGMYENRGTISFLLRFNDKGSLVQIESTFATIDPNEYLNQEIRDLFDVIEKAKAESKDNGYILPLRENVISNYIGSDVDNNIHIHC